jgi:hypothetical protein
MSVFKNPELVNVCTDILLQSCSLTLYMYVQYITKVAEISTETLCV